MRYVLAALLILFGTAGVVEMLTVGYDPQNDDIMLFRDTFRTLINAIWGSYLVIALRLTQIMVGILLFTKKYWWLGLLIHMPVAFNIFFIHMFHDMPPVDGLYFFLGMLLSVSTFILVFTETEKLKRLIV